ncbi:MAG: hypothetical protein JWP88_719 [Flaviaesturariibacter sp.]|nr:hypothetical protein [Flaviaesturariibacter sp.]
MAHEISLDEAIKMTTLYRENKKAIDPQSLLALSETFDRSALDRILAQGDCKKLRIYYGMDEKKGVHAILVGVNEKDEDILPKEGMEGDGELAEDGRRCPNECPPESPLNG